MPGAGIDNSNAICLTASAGGGLTLTAREADQQGYQPFIAGNATTLSFYATETPSDDFVNGGSVPDMQVTVVRRLREVWLHSTERLIVPAGNHCVSDTGWP